MLSVSGTAKQLLTSQGRPCTIHLVHEGIQSAEYFPTSLALSHPETRYPEIATGTLFMSAFGRLSRRQKRWNARREPGEIMN
jgi:hypothetical protein